MTKYRAQGAREFSGLQHHLEKICPVARVAAALELLSGKPVSRSSYSDTNLYMYLDEQGQADIMVPTYPQETFLYIDFSRWTCISNV